MSRVRRQSHPPSLLSLPRSLTTMDGTTGRLPDGVSCGPRPPPSGADYFSVPRALITRRLDPPERVLILSSKHSFVTRPPVNRGHTLNTILARIGTRLGHEIERGDDIPPYYPPPITFFSVSTGPTCSSGRFIIRFRLRGPPRRAITNISPL